MKNESTRIFHKQHNKSDEYYTTLEEVEYIFNEVIREDFTDKIIYCSFDSDESAFVKYISEHKELGYKEFWYTSDDFKNHEDLIQKCDVIISNPPFSLLHKEILPMFKKYNKKFFLFGSLCNMYLYYRTYNIPEIKFIRRENFGFKNAYEKIQKTSGELIYVASLIYLTNLNIEETYKKCNILNKKFLHKSFDDIPHVYDKDGYLTIDKMVDFPNDYYELVRCPITCLEYKYNKIFDYYYKERKDLICGPYTDGKSRFLRILVRRKNI